MSPTSRDEAVAANKWKKHQRAEMRRRARKLYWIRVAADATTEITALSRQQKRPRGIHREMQNAQLDQVVELRKIAIERAQLEGALRAELHAALPVSRLMATKLLRRSDALRGEREERIWLKVSRKKAQHKRNAAALARGETPSGYKLPPAESER
jgi:hypothetical protein